MSGNRSLDEFADAGRGDGADGRRAGNAPATEEATTADPGGAVAADDDDAALEPPASTYVWRPGGGACADCGETVEERWRDGDDLVCAGCKAW